MKPLVIYHAGCADGFTAAWVADRALGGAELRAAHYGEAPPDVAGRDVYVLDFSYPRAVLLRMYSEARSILVLDHHKTAQADLEGLPFCTFRMEESGASLAWWYWHDAEELPPLVAYVRDRDLWRHELPNTREINAWLRSFEFGLDTWDALRTDLERWPDSCVGVGSAILRGERRVVESIANKGRPVTIGGVPAVAVNASHLISEIAGRLAQTTGVGAVWFMRQDGRFQWSLRSTGAVDVSTIARTFGGGGHVAASGFDVNLAQHLAFLLPPPPAFDSSAVEAGTSSTVPS
jgi:hypothetical protein